jgi:hypothetical protein
MDDLKRRIKEAEDRVKGAEAARKRAQVCVTVSLFGVGPVCGRVGVVGLKLTGSRATQPACRWLLLIH